MAFLFLPLLTYKQYAQRIPAAMACYNTARNRFAYLVKIKVLRNQLFCQINQFLIGRAVSNKTAGFVVARILRL